MRHLKTIAIFIAIAFSSLALNSCQENNFFPLRDGLLLAENKDTGLRGVVFDKNSMYPGMEVLSVQYADVTPTVVLYDYRYDEVYLEFIAKETDGKSSLIKVGVFKEKSEDDRYYNVANPQVVIKADTIELIREGDMTYYMCHDSKGKTLVGLRNSDFYAKYTTQCSFGPYDEIIPLFDYNQCFVIKNGLFSVQSLNDFFKYPLYKSPYSDIVLYDMVSAKRKFKYDGWDWTENMGGEFYVYPNGKGGYVMSKMFSAHDKGQYLLPIYTLTAAQWQDICSHDTAEEKYLVKTEYFPASITGKLYKAGRKATMWGIW